MRMRHRRGRRSQGGSSATAVTAAGSSHSSLGQRRGGMLLTKPRGLVDRGYSRFV